MPSPNVYKRTTDGRDMDSSMMFYAAAAMALVPTLVLMYVLLRRYTYPAVERPYFSDPSFFWLFAVGLVSGTVMFLVYSYIMGNIVATLVYAAIQIVVPMMFMNLKRYRGKSDSVFYGLGFGLGAGGATAVGFIYYIANSADIMGGTVDAAGWACLFVLGLALLFQYAAAGTTVGEGIARHNPMQFGIQAMIYNVVFWVVFTIMLMNSGDDLIMYVLSFAVLAISVFYLYYAYTKEIATIADEVDAQNNVSSGRRRRPKLR